MKAAQLARNTIEKFVLENKIMKEPESLFDVSVDKAGAFVSIKTLSDDLRGCIGTTAPTRSNIKQEIIHNAIAAATRDPRFYPIEPHELKQIKISVDILHAPEIIESVEQLNPETYGIIVSSGNAKRALLLPDLDGLDTVEKQVAACMNKAGISQDAPVSIQRFMVDRFFE